MSELPKTFCSKCGNECKPTIFHDKAKTKPADTGYGTDEDGNKICYDCAALRDEERLRVEGKMQGYLVYEKEPGERYRFGEISLKNGYFGNWPGTFKLGVSSAKKSINNFGAERIDFWFEWEGRTYHGVNVGDSQIAVVHRINIKKKR